MKAIIILQARMNSSRLPGKAMLPVGGYPSAILSALRAGNRGRKVTLATSSEMSDDILAKRASEYGVSVFRGPLQDVLARYYLAAADLRDGDAVVRLTGDNVVPDGLFVDELVSAFESQNVDYLGMDRRNRLPYGLCGEAFSVAALRDAHRYATAPEDREHVGPWMKRNRRVGVFIPQFSPVEDLSDLRCTIDDDEDYQRIKVLFSGVTDPLVVAWADVARKLAAMRVHDPESFPQKEAKGVSGRLVLGTAQLGMTYGYTNESGQPTRDKAMALVRTAVSSGIREFDTARAYGAAEEILGRTVKSGHFVTKLDLRSVGPHASDVVVRKAVDASVSRSAKALRRSKLDTLLLHNWEHRSMWRGVAWKRLCELREQNKVGAIGASVYEPAQALEALSDPGIRHLQVPVNVLDHRWKKAGVDQAAMDRGDVVVHARSIFLQGILLHSGHRWPVVAGVNCNRLADKLARFVEQFGRSGLADLCIAYVRSLPWVTAIVLGCETSSQLEENLRLFLTPCLDLDQINVLEEAFSNVMESLLNPSKWNVAIPPPLAYAN